MNEVQYVETEYDIERLQSEGFAVEELETEPTDDAEDTEEKPKRGGRKKAEA